VKTARLGSFIILIDSFASFCSDSRRLADRQLKSTCEAFIDHCGDFLIGPIRVYLAKVVYTIFLTLCLLCVLCVFNNNSLYFIFLF